MEKYEEVLAQLNGLGISVRKMIKVQKEMQSQLAIRQEESLRRHEEFKETQDELMRVMQSMSGRAGVLDAEEWLTKAEVIDELCITDRTFYRRRRAGKWEVKESGGQCYYLKSTLRRGVGGNNSNGG